ncbi:hypothetical protein [Falsibacillus pallidus]
MEITKEMQELCPDAWLINFAYPSEWSLKLFSATVPTRSS